MSSGASRTCSPLTYQSFSKHGVLLSHSGLLLVACRWNYAGTILVITSHMLMLSNFRREEGLWLPCARFIFIIFGFIMASIFNILICPIYAGDVLHKLIAKNLDVAGTVLDRWAAIASSNFYNNDVIHFLQASESAAVLLPSSCCLSDLYHSSEFMVSAQMRCGVHQGDSAGACAEHMERTHKGRRQDLCTLPRRCDE